MKRHYSFAFSRISPCFIVFSIILAFAAMTGAAFAQAGRLQHAAVVSAAAGKAIAITATVQEAPSLPVSGRVYYRRYGEAAFDNTELRVQQDGLSGEIPATAVKEGQLQYYLEATLADASTLTFPEGAPLGADPVTVNVSPAAVANVPPGAGIVILSPEPGAKLADGNVVIAVSFLQSVRAIKPEAIRIILDGKDITGRATVSEQMLVLTIDGVTPGSHNFVLKSGDEVLASWGCFVLTPEAAHRLPGLYHGSLEGGYTHEEVSEQVRNITYLDGRIGTTMGKLDLMANAYVTNLEKSNLQPQDRFLIGAKYGEQVVQFGDVQPRFTEFTVWGKRTRGAQMLLRSPFLNLDFAWGYLYRPVEGTGIMDTTYAIDPVTNDTLKSLINPAADSIVVQSVVVTPGTYTRKILAVRPGFPITSTSAFSFSMMKIKDDISSIDLGANPNDNLVLGADFHYENEGRRIILNSEVAVSGYNSDISSGPSSDAEGAKSIMVINQHFDPLPADTSFLVSGLSKTELAKKVLQELGKSAMAHRTTLSLNYFRNELQLGYRTVGRSFHSLGSPTVETDIRGFSLQDRLRLLNNRLYFTVGYEGYSDNVNGRAPTTTDRTIIRGSFSYYTPPEYPDISFGYRASDRKNDGTLTIYPLAGGGSDTLDNRIDASQNTMNISLDHNFRLMDWDHQVTLTYSGSGTEDNIQADAKSALNALALNLASRDGERLDTRVSVSSTGQSSLKGDYKVNYTDIGLNGRYAVIPKQLWATAGFNLTTASGKNKRLDVLGVADTTDAAKDLKRQSFNLDFSRTRFSVGAEYDPWERHQVRLDAYLTGQSDNSNYLYFSGRKELLKDAPDYIEQNDFVTRLTYTYTF